MATASYGETSRGSPALSTATGTAGSAARGAPAPSSYTPHQATKAGVIPTNTVSYKDGVVRTRIDPVLPVSDVIRQLCSSLRLQEPPTRFALRDETDELVTNENLRKKIKAKSNLKLVVAPAIEAEEILKKIKARGDKLKYALFSLQKYIKEKQFSDEFLTKGGLSELVSVIESETGNTLAYALTSMQNLMEQPYGWSTLDEQFIRRIVQILSSPTSLINVCRPATAILKRLVEADPNHEPNVASSSAAVAATGPNARRRTYIPVDSVYRYGFDVVFHQMRQEEAMLNTVVHRLSSPETAMTLNSLNLINSLLSHASDANWSEFIAALDEKFHARKAVITLMSSHASDDLRSSILDFQANMVKVAFRKKNTFVDPDTDTAHRDALNYIWSASKLGHDYDLDDRDLPIKWRLLGFESEDVMQEFSEVGVLGLDCLYAFVQSDPDNFAKLVIEQNSRPIHRRCPIAQASNEVTEILSDHWAIYAPVYSSMGSYQPLFLNMYKVHTLALLFFLRMWNESGASVNDLNRVTTLTRSQIEVALRDGHSRPWHEVQADFLDSEYRAVRDRQMRELEERDDVLTKAPVRNLRQKLLKESSEFVRQQRIQCLTQGAWFVNAVPLSSSSSSSAPSTRKPWRFMRLDHTQTYLHYVDASTKFPVRAGIEDLPERLDVALIHEIAVGTCVAPPQVVTVLDPHEHVPAGPTSAPSPLSFSLLAEEEGKTLANLVATDMSRWADWTDGLNLLRKDGGGHVQSQETAEFVQALTDIGLKIKLLDLSGEMVDIPVGLTAGPPPPHNDFYFSDVN